MKFRELYPIIEAEFLSEYENVINEEIHKINSSNAPVWVVPYFKILTEEIDRIISSIFEDHNLTDNIVSDGENVFEGTFRMTLSNFLKMNTTSRRELLNQKLSDAMEEHNLKFSN